jgi:histidine triad (HIT) family protein
VRLFCQIAKREQPATILFEDEELVAFADIRPVAPTHVLVIPRRHITSLDDARPDDALLLGKLVLAATRVAQERRLASGWRLVVNTGKDAGQSVSHVHVHVLGGRAMRWPPG